jgi:hypothetical protein
MTCLALIFDEENTSRNVLKMRRAFASENSKDSSPCGKGKIFL